MADLNLTFSSYLLAQLFIVSAILDFKNYPLVLGLMQKHGIPYPKLLLPLALLLKVAGGMGLLYLPLVLPAACALSIFILIATFIFEPFWKKSNLERDLSLVKFLTHLAVVGGLMGVGFA